MNLANKLIINYRECANIYNPFYFSYSQVKNRMPIYTMGNEVASFYTNDRGYAKVTLSTNPDNINIDINTMGQRKELTVYNKGQLMTLQDIYEIECSINYMTGCYEFEIKCLSLLLGGLTNE